MEFMRKNILLAATAIAALVSCDNNENGSPVDAEFSATIAAYRNGPTMTWSASDKIGVVSSGRIHELSATTSGTTSLFSGEVVEASRYQAISPYTSSITFSDGKFSAEIPREQKAVTDGIAPGSCVATAFSSTPELNFEARNSLLKISLMGDKDIASIKFKALGEEALTGKILVSPEKKEVEVIDGYPEIVFTPNGEVFSEGTYYIATIPGKYVDGIECTMTDTKGRVCANTTIDLLFAKEGSAVDLGTIDETAEFMTPSLAATPHDLSAVGDGETVSSELSEAFTNVTLVEAPDWATISVSGSTVRATVTENPLTDDVRYGKIHIEGNIASGSPATADIIIAQGAKGHKLVYDSFTGNKLREEWRGNASRSGLKLEDGCLKMTGTGEYNNGANTYPLFYTGAQARQKYAEIAFNRFMCTIDIKADGRHGGIIGFNAYGYKDDGTCDFTSKQNYITYISAMEGGDGGGYFCFNSNSPNAMDGWTKPEGTSVTKWIRLEMSNIGRGGDYVDGNWGVKAIWSLEEDENGLLQKKDLLFHGTMWWWNDAPQLGYQYGYFGIFAKDPSEVSFRNFTLSYQDN